MALMEYDGWMSPAVSMSYSSGKGSLSSQVPVCTGTERKSSDFIRAWAKLPAGLGAFPGEVGDSFGSLQ